MDVFIFLCFGFFLDVLLDDCTSYSLTDTYFSFLLLVGDRVRFLPEDAILCPHFVYVHFIPDILFDSH